MQGFFFLTLHFEVYNIWYFSIERYPFFFLMDSLKCLSAECVNLLHKNQVLLPLIRSELKASLLSEVQIDKETETKALQECKSKFKITNESELDNFLDQNNLDYQKFVFLALFPLREKKILLRYTKIKYFYL